LVSCFRNSKNGCRFSLGDEKRKKIRASLGQGACWGVNGEAKTVKELNNRMLFGWRSCALKYGRASEGGKAGPTNESWGGKKQKKRGPEARVLLTKGPFLEPFKRKKTRGREKPLWKGGKKLPVEEEQVEKGAGSRAYSFSGKKLTKEREMRSYPVKNLKGRREGAGKNQSKGEKKNEEIARLRI